MDLARLLRPELILLELETKEIPEAELGDVPIERYHAELKEQILGELVDLLDRSGRVGSKGKLLADLVNREKKATTGLAHGVAIPHVRTMHARDFLIGFARSTPGIWFDCFDGEPAHLFFVMVAPPYNDISYLRIYKTLAEAFSIRDLRREFMEAQSEGEVLRALKRMGQG